MIKKKPNSINYSFSDGANLFLRLLTISSSFQNPSENIHTSSEILQRPSENLQRPSENLLENHSPSLQDLRAIRVRPSGEEKRFN